MSSKKKFFLIIPVCYYIFKALDWSCKRTRRRRSYYIFKAPF